MSYYEDGSVDQFKLPIAYAFGAVEQVILNKDFETWALARQKLCGHRDPVESCRVCIGTMRVNEAVSWGSDGVRVFPER